MSRTTRALALAVSTLVLAAGLAGCGSGQARTGAAAIVGEQRLGTDALSALIEDALAATGVAPEISSDVPTFQRSVLTEFITVEVVEEAARRAGVELPQSAVDSEYAAIEEQLGGPEGVEQQAAAAGLSVERVRGIARTRALTAAIGASLAGGPVDREQLEQAYGSALDQYDQVRVAEILLPTLEAAQALLPEAQAADDEGFAALATAQSTDQQTAAQGGDLGLVPRAAFLQAGQLEVARQLETAQVGDVFVAPVEQGGVVVRLLERQTTTLEEATPELEAQIQGPQREAAVEAAVREAADALAITVNPRFGRWDAAALSVVAGDDRELSRPAGEPVPADEPPGGLPPQP